MPLGQNDKPLLAAIAAVGFILFCLLFLLISSLFVKY
jgi:hypothetical protein